MARPSNAGALDQEGQRRDEQAARGELPSGDGERTDTFGAAPTLSERGARGQEQQWEVRR